MTWNKNHPARSHAFLSRLHDGELSPAERAHFEAHRAHCAQCRNAAAEYEHALSLFRSARSSPPPADMATRVLRKVQSVGRPRRPLAASPFSVDWRWASAFAAALLVLLVATPLVFRQPEKLGRVEAPIPVSVQDRQAAPADAAAASGTSTEARDRVGDLDSRQRAQKPAAPAPQGFAQAPDETRIKQESVRHESWRAKSLDAEVKPQSDAAAPSSSQPARRPQAAPANRAAAAQGEPTDRLAASAGGVATPAPAPASPERGGEGARERAPESTVLEKTARLIIQELDGQGSAPQLEARLEQSDLTGLRGRSFVLLVEASGRVRDARETAAKTAPVGEAKRNDLSPAKEKDAAADALKRLRFAAGERPRRLLLRVE